MIISFYLKILNALLQLSSLSRFCIIRVSYNSFQKIQIEKKYRNCAIFPFFFLIPRSFLPQNSKLIIREIITVDAVLAWFLEKNWPEKKGDEISMTT